MIALIFSVSMMFIGVAFIEAVINFFLIKKGTWIIHWVQPAIEILVVGSIALIITLKDGIWDSLLISASWLILFWGIKWLFFDMCLNIMRGLPVGYTSAQQGSHDRSVLDKWLHNTSVILMFAVKIVVLAICVEIVYFLPLIIK